jgi:exosome complex exonuclease RRP6
VDTEATLYEMLEDLKAAKEIAIDLEHHDQRSYIGIVSLMQISTRDRDWIVDTLKPWRRRLQVLNEVFTDPNIVKILHGAYMDIVWLQRDLGLYIVGLFDTHYAARALGYPGGSLAFLLKKFANVDAQKQYQMADWRIRPLPQELFDYARSDTHYLLYIFDCMRNELIQRSNLMLPDHDGDKLWHVLQKSNETALQRYEHPVYDFDLGQGTSGWYKMISRTSALFTKEQFAVFRAVHKWRDDVAREQDDSTHYVMPNYQVFSIAREMPTNRAAILGLAQPTTQTVRLRADELVNVIVTAKEDGKNGPEMAEVLGKIEPLAKPAKHAKDTPLIDSVASYLPHNTSQALTVNGSAVMPFRSRISTFWGDAFDSSAHLEDLQRRPLHSLASNVDLKIPLPALSAEVFKDSLGESLPATPVLSQPTSPPEPAPTNEEDNSVFVLKEMGRKRKRTDDMNTSQGDGMVAQSDEVVVEDDQAEHQREKQARRKAKKEAKRAAKRAASGAEVDANDEAAEEGPFDYNAAPSILNPPRESREEMRERKKREVNPYAKALDTPKGLPRSQKERAGKSMTYQ